MKVKEIYIKEFRQFKDFTLDLTYPKGHAKEGLPLDKVCFIGQSGTGKTNLLKLLYVLRIPSEWKEKFNAPTNEFVDKIAFKAVNLKNGEIIISFKNSIGNEYELIGNPIFSFNKSSNSYKDVLKSDFKATHSEEVENMNFFYDSPRDKEKLIFLPAGLKYDFKETNKNEYVEDKNRFDFSKESIYWLWDFIAKDISKYQEEELKLRQKISFLAEKEDIVAMQKEVLALKEWKEKNISPMQTIAEKCINPLIKNFSLKVKEEFSIEQKEDIGFIKLESLVGKEIPYNSWSTGTKQVVLSALPLYLIQPENSTILFDEPETSLYPDLQRVIIDYYTNLVKENNQFFYATHSPIIASSFEPWEIVELKFNEDGFVFRDKYYEGENHVDNYYIDPRFLNYDLMLKKVFDMKFTNADKRYEALSEFEMLKNQLEKLKQENKLQTEEAKSIYKKFKDLSTKLTGIPKNPTQYAQA